MAINGQGFFVVQKPHGFSRTQPMFDGSQLYAARRLPARSERLSGQRRRLLSDGHPDRSQHRQSAGSVPQMLQFQNNFLPAQATTEIDYRANLATTRSPPITIPPFRAPNCSIRRISPPIRWSLAPRRTPRSPATAPRCSPMRQPSLTGSPVASASLSSAGGTIDINGTTITINAGDNAAAVLTAINAQTGTTGVTASLDCIGQLVLTSADADTNIDDRRRQLAGVLSELGLSAGTTNATNLLTQSAAAAGQTLTITIGGNPTLHDHFRHRRRRSQRRWPNLNTALAALSGGTAAVDAPTAISPSPPLTRPTRSPSAAMPRRANFGIHTSEALPANGTVIGHDETTFLNESIVRRRHHRLRHVRLRREHAAALGEDRFRPRSAPAIPTPGTCSIRPIRPPPARRRPGQMPASTTRSAPTASSTRRSIRSRYRT